MNAAALLAAMLAAVHAQHSVHYVSAAASNGTKIEIIGGVGRTQGIQRITFTQGGMTGHATVIVADRTAYVRGDAFTLHSFLGIASENAANVAGRWVRIPHT